MGAAATKPKTVRVDPAQRPADRAFEQTKVLNADPDRVYAWVKVNGDDQYTPPFFEHMGYQVETMRPGGPRALVGRTAKDGEPILYMDTVLMSVSRERKLEIDREGPFGATGQEYLDHLDKRMLAPKGYQPGAGERAPYLSFQNDSEAT